VKKVVRTAALWVYYWVALMVAYLAEKMDFVRADWRVERWADKKVVHSVF